MGFELNNKIKNLVPYTPICGDYEVRLDANESFISLREDILEDITKAISKMNFNRYPDCVAEDVCQKFANYYDLNRDSVVAYNGSDESIFVIMSSFLDKGDTVYTLAPDFSMYKFYCSLVDCECIEFNKDFDFKVDFKKLTDEINKTKARMIIFSNPCNPTSVGFESKDIEYLIKNTDALVVLDEAYMDFFNQSLLQKVNEYDNLIILKTCSKAVGFAAARLGFTVANKTLTNVLMAAKSPYNVNTITQVSASILLENQEYLKECKEEIVKSTNELYCSLKTIENELDEEFRVYETNTNFICVKTNNAQEIFEFMKSNSIVIRNIGNKYLRITSGTKDENEKVINVLKKYFKVG